MRDTLDFFDNLIKGAATGSIDILAENSSATDDGTYKFLESNYIKPWYEKFSGSFIDDLLYAKEFVKGAFIVGEAGIGKSTFIKQLIKRPNKIIKSMKNEQPNDNLFKISAHNSLTIDFNIEITPTENLSTLEYTSALSKIILDDLSRNSKEHGIFLPKCNSENPSMVDVEQALVETSKFFYEKHTSDFILPSFYFSVR